MKIFIIFLLCQLSLPLFGKDEAKLKMHIPKDHQLRFVPLFPDSLTKDSLSVLLFPEQSPQFQRQMGVIFVPDPDKVEFNPGGIVNVDPSVDAGMIYPFEARQKILLGEENRLKNQRRFYRLPLEEKDKKENSKKESKEKE